MASAADAPLPAAPFSASPNQRATAVIERKALIFNIQKYNMYDGPGVRTLVFFKGCPLRCRWCSNPESQSRQFQILLKRDLCVLCGACERVCPTGVHKVTPQGHEIVKDAECIGCGKCSHACPKSALAVMGEQKTISELLEIVEEDRPFYETSGGGLTIGGGEVLMQPDAAANLLLGCRQRGIHTAIETSGYARPEALAKVAESVDLFLYDIKHMNPERHHELTGVRNETILSNLEWLLQNRHNVKIRLPLLKGLNDGDDEMRDILRFLKPYLQCRNFKGVDILPYHKMGVHKYEQLGRQYQIEGDPKLSDADIDRLEAIFRADGVAVTTIRH